MLRCDFCGCKYYPQYGHSCESRIGYGPARLYTTIEPILANEILESAPDPRPDRIIELLEAIFERLNT